MLDIYAVHYYYSEMNDWTEILIAENIPLNCKLVFHLQHGGINMILLNGKQLTISKESRRILGQLLAKYRTVEVMGKDFSDVVYPSPLSIYFHDGAPAFRRQDYKYFKMVENAYCNDLTHQGLYGGPLNTEFAKIK